MKSGKQYMNKMRSSTELIIIIISSEAEKQINQIFKVQ